MMALSQVILLDNLLISNGVNLNDRASGGVVASVIEG